MKFRLATFAIILAMTTTGLAQRGPRSAPGNCGPGMGGYGPMMGGPGMGAGMMYGLRGPGMGAWWRNSAVVKQLGLSDAQVKQIDKIFLDQRSKLIDLQAELQKQELALQPLIEADQPNKAQVTAQIDRVAQARANLEKSHAEMLLGIRGVLTPAQWKQLQSGSFRPGPGAGGPRGPAGSGPQAPAGPGR